MKLFAAFVFLCVVGTALAATQQLKLNSQLKGDLLSGSQTYQFSYSHDTTSRYQLLYVLPQLEAGSDRLPVVKIDKTNVIDFKSDVSCSASASSSDSQIKCAYSFQGCVKTAAPQNYTITVQPPALSGSANINYTIGAINIAASLSAATQSLTKQVTCCGFSGASWHYVKASGAEVINSVSITLTKGSLTTSTLATGTDLTSLLPPGVFIIPDTQVCLDLSLESFLKAAKNIADYAKALTKFAVNLSANSEDKTVKVSLDGSLAVPGVSYWVLVVPNSDSSAEYTISTEYSGTSSAASLATPFSSLF
jgi:hypothetical protein